MARPLALLLLAVVQPLLLAATTVGAEVLELSATENNFAQALAAHPKLLVMFYAPWCGHCKAMKPAFEAAAAQVQLPFARVDCDATANKELCAAHGVSGFPTVKYFEAGAEPRKYSSGRSEAKLVRFATEQWTGEKVEVGAFVNQALWEDNGKVVHLTEDHFDAFREETPELFVMFYAPWCGHCKSMKPDFAKASETAVLPFAAVDCTVHGELCKKSGAAGYPTIIYFPPTGDEREEYFGNRSLEDMLVYTAHKKKHGVEKPMTPAPTEDPQPEEEEAAATATQPEEDEAPTAAPPAPVEAEAGKPAADFDSKDGPVHHLDGSSFEAFRADNPKLLVIFYAPWCGHCKAMKPDYAAAAAQVDLPFAAVDCDATANKELCAAHGVSGFPTVKYFEAGAETRKYSSGRSEAKLVRFATEQWTGEKVEVGAFVNQALWEDNGKVVHLTEDHFDAFKQELNGAMLVMFYAPWCGHCKSMKPDFARASGQSQGVTFAAVDCTVHGDLCGKHDARAYPTLRYFGKAPGFDEEYHGARSEKALLEYVAGRLQAESAGPAEPVEDAFADAAVVTGIADDTFADYRKAHPQMFVLFYAPWCGHCKAVKPEWVKAAKQLPDVPFLAIDCTVAKKTCGEFARDGYPTLKLFDGETIDEFEQARAADKLVTFVGDKLGVAVAAAPEEELPVWTPNGKVAHLTTASFAGFRKSSPEVLVMFYAPWCGHCTGMKPAFAAASEQAAFPFAAVDCTANKALCTQEQTDGYPTLIYYPPTGEAREEYRGARSEANLVAYAQRKSTKGVESPMAPAKRDEL